MKRVLFLCTGNYYRSRFAEIYFNWHAPLRGIAWRADSRGLALDPRNVGHISQHTAVRLAELGIPLGDVPRYPREAADADFDAADHVVAVKAAEHRSLMETNFAAHVDCVEYWNVDDLDCAGPQEAIPRLESEVRRLLDRLAGHNAVFSTIGAGMTASETTDASILNGDR
jgi:protein-tyrosine phosphatase